MIYIDSFTFNPFQENTYILWDETKECLIIDPGCSTSEEQGELSSFILENGLNPVKLLLTHAHVDHVMGNQFIFEKYALKPHMHIFERDLLHRAPAMGANWGIPVYPSPEPEGFLDEKDTISFGNSELKILFTPGHSPGSICFYNAEEGFVIAGDVLFRGSIGRTDLPGGDYNTLISSVRNNLFLLDDAVKVFPGHGPSTTIGFEKQNNPFVKIN